MRNAVIALLLLFSSAELFVDEYVVLLHGLARTSASLNTMQEAGYATANIDYPSREHAIEELAGIAIEEGLAMCRSQENIEKIYLVTHSLGGTLVR